MQLRLPTKLTSEDYVKQLGWEKSSLPACPWHPLGHCDFRRHGFYDRRSPEMRVARWYCRREHRTVSLLPDFAASRLPGTLAEVEDAVVAFEHERAQGATVEQAAHAVRPDIEATSAVRWVGRRRRWVLGALVLLVGLHPEAMQGRALTVDNARRSLNTPCVLVRMREIAAENLQVAARPLGFFAMLSGGELNAHQMQHDAGADPPTPNTLGGRRAQ